MTRNEVIEMAGKVYGTTDFHKSALFHLEAFAKLVAAKEREACAKVCEAINAVYNKPEDMAERFASQWCADRIRARGEA